jgi:hypothetical protein
MSDTFDVFEGDEPLRETAAAFDLSALTVREATLALQLAMMRESGTRSQTIRDVPIGPDLHVLKFGVGEAEFIQERHDMGPQYALELIGAGRWTVKLLGDVVFAALVGGGAKPEAARRVVEKWVTGRPWAESAPLAQIILQAGVVGVPDEPPGKDEGAAAMTDPPTSPEEKSGSAPSTDTPPSPV